MIFNYVSMETILLSTVVLYLLYKLLWKNFDYWEKRKVPYIQPVPLFGNFFEIATMKYTIGEYLAKLYNNTNEPFFGIFVFNTPCMVIKSPELIKSVLVKDFNHFYDRTVASCEHDPLTDNMLFLNKNPDWKVLRKLLTPVFTSGKLKAMLPLINKIGEDMKDYILKLSDNDCLEAKEICAKYSTNVIAKCAFAINAHSFDRENPDFRRIGKMVFNFNVSNAVQQTSFFFLPFLVKLFKMRFVPKEAGDFLNTVFWKAVDERERTNQKGNDLIDCIVEIRKNKELTSQINFEGEKVVAQAAQFFLAGFETTSSTMAFTLYELCIHPHIQNKLRKEIKSEIQKDGLTYEAINNMKFLHMCVCETLRKYPVLPFLDRMCVENYKIPGTEAIIEKGTPIYIPMLGLHYDPDFFHSPEKYIPERFSEENVNNLKGFSYIPFGEGPRNCIGERFGMLGTKVGLIHILSEFELIKTKETPVPLVYEPKSFVLASKVGLPMKFKKITTSAA